MFDNTKDEFFKMEIRHEFGGGTMSTYYGLFKYEKRYANGTLANGKLVKRFNKKPVGLKYCNRYGITLAEENNRELLGYSISE